MAATQEDLPLVCVMHTDDANVMRLATKLANQAAVADIQCNACHTELDGATWWDVRPMLDPREHAPQAVDMAQMALDYAVLAGLAARHPEQPHLLRITSAGMQA